jgi:hypothetical protein
MDEICEALANKIYAASCGAYAIFYEDELFEAFPDPDKKSRENLETALSTLSKLGYIDVKYAKGYAFCIAGLKRCETSAVNKITESQNKLPDNKYKLCLCLFLSALSGGLLGGLFGGLFAALII